jgi:hypothetical protein
MFFILFLPLRERRLFCPLSACSCSIFISKGIVGSYGFDCQVQFIIIFRITRISIHITHFSLETQRTFCSEAQDVGITSNLQIYFN